MAWMLRTIGFREEEIKVVGASLWWNEADVSEQWQKNIYLALSTCYALVSFAALVQLVRIQMRVPEYGWTTQKVFHFMNFLVNGLRAVLFGLYKSVLLIRPKALEQVLMDLPGLLFFSTYTLLVLFWAEIYHQARSAPAHKLRPAYFIINGLIYFTQVCIWISMRASKAAAGLEAAKIFLAVISFCSALGFLIYGGRLFVLLRRFPIESRGRQKKLYEEASSKKMIGRGDKHEGLYILNTSYLNSISTSFVNHVSFHVWHNRLGHISFKRLDSLKRHLHCDFSCLNKN